MSGKAGLKAGLIGAGVMVVLVLLNLIPSLIQGVGVLGCACCGVELLAYAGAGVLAGAIAGVISGVGAGIMTIITAAGRMAFTNVQSAIDPVQARQLIEAGIDPKMLAIFAGWGGVFLFGSLCCLGWIAIGAGLGALGGLIFASAKKD
jgi:hypothetical protein